MSDRFFTKRLELDQLFSRSSSRDSHHWAGSTVKAIAVLRSNNPNFQLTFTPDPFTGSVQGVPLREGFFMNFQTQLKNGVFENSIVQPGTWVDVIISTEDNFDSNPAQSKPQSSTIEVGHARGELDGLSRQLLLNYWASLQPPSCADIDDPSANVSVLNINGGNSQPCWKVPNGYVAEVIGCQLNITTAMSNPASMRLYAVNEGAVIVEGGNPQDELGYVFGHSDAVGEYMVRVFNACAPGQKGFDRRGIILHAGETPLLMNNGATVLDGHARAHLLVRLKPVASV